MTNNWYMLTLIGEDKPGIVAAVTQALFERGLNLGETSMLRLGGNFTIMMMVGGVQQEDELRAQLKPVIEAQGMRLHVDAIQGRLHEHVLPNIQVTVTGADRAGIVAQVTAALTDVGFNILDLESDVAGTAHKPVYIMQIAGVADAPIEKIEAALEALRKDGVDVNVNAIDTYIG
ncbi:MAG: ACT domain-containing protein [Gammaproteobacteria bacterium]|nr:ACT domain-containing protein [Gammaproteobacteria bacterium]